MQCGYSWIISGVEAVWRSDFCLLSGNFWEALLWRTDSNKCECSVNPFFLHLILNILLTGGAISSCNVLSMMHNKCMCIALL